MQAARIPFLFLTNNTTKSPEDVVDNLAKNHDIHVTPDQIYTPSLATAAYLTDLNHGDVSGKSVYIIGELGLKQALLDTGLRLNEVDPDYVVVGLDYDVTYHKFELATWPLSVAPSLSAPTRIPTYPMNGDWFQELGH